MARLYITSNHAGTEVQYTIKAYSDILCTIAKENDPTKITPDVIINAPLSIIFNKYHVTQPDAYPMPRVDELLDRLGKATYLSTIDLARGYWQVPVSPSDRYCC